MKRKSGLLIQQGKHDKLTVVCLDCRSENQFLSTASSKRQLMSVLTCMHVLLLNSLKIIYFSVISGA